jgi:hypothetical protein
VNGVEAPGLVLVQLGEAQADHLQPGLFDEADDAADRVLGDRVGFDDAEGSFDGHVT